ncbi:hypothetical protein PHYBLDRAFT_149544 [Phycomyces blakesleeanus NRRL 1555(-)]|uniref:Uncharacterized protein n=1 Tax=Phycomyces blakesleeanus (strain ATCC 8743b / DSM 1359 / FGSC 10004 / NBRC 33097 / NRRL 1555) TaxID=763407 RepID=A0A162NFQ3_PHYB8|nr:hypothetical protein PHYBLDRAFT_149544 [Phycomyces blakesleeanus NRRL 1555(-)]OAD69144.1 hypothetical protein PHYBLDRAFT_149544 [Phycomyces blakesleeanus NRRL 1555(-)]|eukprot:XP_018287184.1 hypothetical protein PHYBLDRAFT_149544 [Phycomyces blakesleeanus NRRL 1555(-)]
MTATYHQPLHTILPDQHGIECIVKVIDILVTIEKLHESSNTLIQVSEYIVEWEPEDVIHLKDAYTQVIQGSLRLVGTATLSSTKAPSFIPVENNFSLVNFVRSV